MVSLIPTLLPGGEGLFFPLPSGYPGAARSYGRRPVSPGTRLEGSRVREKRARRIASIIYAIVNRAKNLRRTRCSLRWVIDGSCACYFGIESGPRERPRVAALSGSQIKAPGSAGRYLLWPLSFVPSAIRSARAPSPAHVRARAPAARSPRADSPHRHTPIRYPASAAAAVLVDYQRLVASGNRWPTGLRLRLMAWV